MLVVSRVKGQRILIGEQVWLTVISSGKKVRLGFEAPDEIRIRREEALPPGRENAERGVRSAELEIPNSEIPNPK